MDIWFGNVKAEAGLKEVEVGPGIGLLDMTCEHPAISAPGLQLGRFPLLAASFLFFLADQHVDPPGLQVEPNDVPGP